MGRKLGDSTDPLLVSVRSGAKFSMPGMMDTVLNLGLNDKSVIALATTTNNERFAYDSYRRFISMYGRIVLGLDGEVFEHALDKAKEVAHAKTDADIPAPALKELCEVYKKAVATATGKPFPQDPAKQLRGAVEAVFRSWNGPRAIAYRVREKISHELGTAVNVQAMVLEIAMTTQARVLVSLVTQQLGNRNRTETSWSMHKVKMLLQGFVIPKISMH